MIVSCSCHSSRLLARPLHRLLGQNGRHPQAIQVDCAAGFAHARYGIRVPVIWICIVLIRHLGVDSVD